MARALGKGFALIIRGHGAVTVGESIEAACLSAISLERTAELQFMACMLLLSQSVKEDFQTPLLLEPKGEDIKVFINKKHFDFYLAKLKKYLKK
jgi:ribulose-5-phosphate 4-epimerase/fuculose-1-phosphate aldolase